MVLKTPWRISIQATGKWSDLNGTYADELWILDIDSCRRIKFKATGDEDAKIAQYICDLVNKEADK